MTRRGGGNDADRWGRVGSVGFFPTIGSSRRRMGTHAGWETTNDLGESEANLCTTRKRTRALGGKRPRRADDERPERILAAGASNEDGCSSRASHSFSYPFFGAPGDRMVHSLDFTATTSLSSSVPSDSSNPPNPDPNPSKASKASRRCGSVLARLCVGRLLLAHPDPDPSRGGPATPSGGGEKDTPPPPPPLTASGCRRSDALLGLPGSSRR